MARLQRSYGRPIQTRSRRAVSWSLGPTSEGVGFTGAAKSFWTTGINLTIPKATLVRIRGDMLINGTLFTSANDGFRGASGLGIVSADAFNNGVASVPGPGTDPDWPGWIWHSYWHVRGIAAQSAGADVSINSFCGVQRIVIDSKAMRKWGNNEVLMGVSEPITETGVASIIIDADTRLLIKEY